MRKGLAYTGKVKTPLCDPNPQSDDRALVCPYCLGINEDDNLIDMLDRREWRDIKCLHCDKFFLASYSVEITFQTDTKEEGG